MMLAYTTPSATGALRSCWWMVCNAARAAARQRQAQAKAEQSDLTPSPSSLSRPPVSSPQSAWLCQDLRGARALSVM